MQILLDSDNDIGLAEDGQIALTTDPLTTVQQRICCRLRTFRGELFDDRRIGVPYFEQFASKNPDIGSVRALLLSEIASVEGVDSVTELDVDFDRKERVFHLKVAVTVNGETLEFNI